MGRARTDRSLGVVVGGLMSLTSTVVVALPALASAAPATHTFDIWNLTSTALNVVGYDKAGTYRMLPPESLPTAKVIPMGKNLQLIVPAGYGVITKLAGSQQAQKGGTQTWEVHTDLETLDSFPAPVPHMACLPGDTRNAACG